MSKRDMVKLIKNSSSEQHWLTVPKHIATQVPADSVFICEFKDGNINYRSNQNAPAIDPEFAQMRRFLISELIKTLTALSESIIVYNDDHESYRKTSLREFRMTFRQLFLLNNTLVQNSKAADATLHARIEACFREKEPAFITHESVDDIMSLAEAYLFHTMNPQLPVADYKESVANSEKPAKYTGTQYIGYDHD